MGASFRVCRFLDTRMETDEKIGLIRESRRIFGIVYVFRKRCAAAVEEIPSRSCCCS
jgi:hypothetical protein